MNIKTLISKAGALSLLLLAFNNTKVSAQLHPLGAMYFQNQYLANPAMAGLEQGLRADLAYRKQWSSIPGAPETQSLTADYGSAKKSGVGISIYNDEAGLQKKTRVMGSYAYHLPLNSTGAKLSFGISLGFMDERLMNEKMNTVTPDYDVAVNKYADRETYVDGDFGFALSSNKLNFQGAIPNLKTFFGNDQHKDELVDQARYFASLSYKFYLANTLEGMGIEPKVVYRDIRGYKSIADIGTNLTLANNQVNVMGMYHTNESATIGMGVKYRSLMQINGMYTSGTSAIQGYTNGNFELNLRVNISKLKL
ncbi:PorP/SprF family type IX secretion system membrane protein [Desertivirga xinjiangensis]|uniref:PorP/SprF family type IX secretion system membrane protein n=1 Tax=Desertivirga xinjiangensis TaxID=539206 RepID=UPI00210D7C90|nr:PorP/SprF family type IX secretion system membrane protein [Pedobacter xinjiangensis]